MFSLYYLASQFPVARQLKDSPMFAVTKNRVTYIFRHPVFASVRSGLSGLGKMLWRLFTYGHVLAERSPARHDLLTLQCHQH